MSAEPSPPLQAPRRPPQRAVGPSWHSPRELRALARERQVRWVAVRVVGCRACGLRAGRGVAAEFGLVHRPECARLTADLEFQERAQP